MIHYVREELSYVVLLMESRPCSKKLRPGLAPVELHRVSRAQQLPEQRVQITKISRTWYLALFSRPQ